MHACMHKRTHACVHAYTHTHTYTRMHACMQTCTNTCMHACIHASRHVYMYAQGQFWAWKHGEQRWKQLPTRGDHPHSLTEAVGLTLPAAAGSKTLGVVFGGFYNSGYCGGLFNSPHEISLASEEDVLVMCCMYIAYYVRACVHACMHACVYG